MNEPFDPELQSTAQHVADLCRRVDINPQHKARLREELMRRHQVLLAEKSQRAAGSFWSRLTGLKRLTLVAPPALAAAVIAFLVLSGLQISGHETTTSAEAAHMTQALARTVPTVTAWQTTVQRHRADNVSSYLYPATLRPGQQLYLSVRHDMRGSAAYLYSNGHWYPVAQTWPWAFLALPSYLAHPHLTFLGRRTIAGHVTEGFRYVQQDAHGQTIALSNWVDRKTGLILHMERLISRGGAVIERDTADYRYNYRVQK